MTTRILVGDVRERLAELPDQSVHCCVTSPPYYGLRDYGVEGQIGLEPTLTEYLEAMVEVFREVRRVLRDDGTLWLNIGDSYASAWPCNRRNVIGNGSLSNGKRENRAPRLPDGLKEKDLMMVPARLAIALQAGGWYLRSDIIWHKTAPMPENVGDRPTQSHEHIFMLSKRHKYFYDAESATEETANPDRFHSGRVGGQTGHLVRHSVGGVIEGKFATRNMRNVWSLGPEPFPDAHFAVYPTEIPRRAIKAGCPKGGTVLDPFLGSGTTLMVADQLGRHGIGIELNPEYAAMAERRIRGDAPMFADVTVEPATRAGYIDSEVA